MTRFAKHLAATSVALVLAAGTALAQQPAAQPQAAAPQPSASHLAAAMEVVVNSGVAGSFDGAAEPLLDELRQMRVARPEVKKDLNEVVDMLKPEMDLQRRRMLNATARIYATHFTEAELKEIGVFFKSPAGRRYVDVQLKATEDLVKELEKWNREVAEYVMIRAKAEMAKRGHPLN
ncbi:MAG TPA: DUF2059 domain-containing protein [Microvirga sp.]|jgi:hypothetical protein|nr:DUF2059 domain-containing protein [Microvirga sp.]